MKRAKKLGKKKSDQKEWISAETIPKLNLRKTKKEIINTSRTRANIPPAEAELQINIEQPSKAGIKKAITALRNGKAAGPDEIPPEAIKEDMETSANLLYDLLSKLWIKDKCQLSGEKAL
ncbi:hypothetical protein ElyMa_003630800 [Elysia marginata]|uniref:Reverse transcriptase domain-containing protein n=1 Tax=Elysia marginata TaxID=1093978 RepID=A0AAV4EVK6_9GAST|nr:hypothetical protein ElyMa_003630800 [Elysia marginata]